MKREVPFPEEVMEKGGMKSYTVVVKAKPTPGVS